MRRSDRSFEDDHVVQTLSADRTNQPLDIRILPGTSRSDSDLLDVHRCCTIPKRLAVDPVPVAQQEPGSRFPREGFADLLCRPLRRGMGGNVEMQNPASIVGQHDEHEQDPKRQGRHDKEVHRY